MPLISIIVPVYNVEKYLHRCVDSILRQSFSDFELILVDDGSPDNCGGICDDYAEKDYRIHVIHQKNGGLSSARNAGIDWAFSNSDSQWLAFIDSDDWIHRDYLHILLSAVEKHNVMIAACEKKRTESFCEDCELREYNIMCVNAEKAYVNFYPMVMSAWAKIYRKDLFEQLRFPVGKLHEDCYITHIPLFQAGKIVVCDVPLYYYFSNPSSITRAKWSAKRLEELESHEHRAAWLKERGHDSAYRREIEVYVMTIYEHAEILAILSEKDASARVCLNEVQNKLKKVFSYARKLGLYAFEREYLWLYVMNYGGVSIWRWLQNLRTQLRK